MNNKMLTIFVSIIVAGVVVGASLPIFASFTTSKETHTNDGAGWIRFNYDTNASEYEISLTESEDGITITNGSDTQTYSFDSTEEFNTILYADTNLSVWVDDDNIHVLGLVDGSPVYFEGSGDFTITRTADGVTFDNSVTFDAPTWAYVPWSSGSYGFFTPSEEGVVTYPADMPNAIVGGGYAGVYAYNNIIRYGLNMDMTATYNGNKLTGAEWDVIAPDTLEIQPFNPGDIIFNPLNPIIDDGHIGLIEPITIDPPYTDDSDPLGLFVDPVDLDDDAGVGLMSTPPTPMYNDGVWGFNVRTSGGVTYAVIVSYSGSGGNITVPSTVSDGSNTYDVLEFGKNGAYSTNCVFDNDQLAPNSTLTFNNNLQKINPGCCGYCSNITGALVIPDSVTTLGTQTNYGNTYTTFGKTGITSVTFGSGLTEIGIYSFWDCDSLTSVTLSNNISIVGMRTFSGCNGLTSFVAGSGLNTIKSGAFYECNNLSTLSLNEGLTTVENEAFYNCTALPSLTLPSTITSIGNSAFNNCTGLRGNLVIPNGVSVISDASFRGCGFDGTLTLPANLTSINAMAFSGCSGFTGALVIPEGCTTITQMDGGNYGAFIACSGFTSLTLPSTITRIGQDTFRACTGFSNALVLPQSLNYIGANCFSGCSGLTGSIYINATTFNGYAFMDCSSLTGVTFGPNVTKIPVASFYRSGITNIVFHDNITEIASGAFESCQSLMGPLMLPSGLITLGNGAFDYCTSLTGSLTLPEGLTTIGGGAFSRCAGLTGVLVIPSSVTSIGSNSSYGGGAFMGCTGLTGLVLNEGLTTIGGGSGTSWPDGVFSGCTNLTGTLIIPSTVTSILNGSYTFYNTGFNSLIMKSDNIDPSATIFRANSNIREVLNLTDLELTTTSYGLNADSVQDNIGDCLGFNSVVSYTTGGDSTPTQTLIAMLPLVMVAGLVIMAVVMLISKKI